MANDIRIDCDDTVKYELFASSIDEATAQKYNEYLSSISDNHHLKLELHKNRNIYYGCYTFGKDLEDEWLIVYLLFELSKYDPDLVIKIYDNDGEILLIEAADYIPRWLESKKSKNRVFVHKGKVHIVPEYVNLKTLSVHYNFSDLAESAAKFIRDVNNNDLSSLKTFFESNQIFRIKSIESVASGAIQSAILEQLSGLPDKKAWLCKKIEQLDAIISDNNSEQIEHLKKNFEENLSLASLVEINDEDLRISPISSLNSSLKDSSSSSWLTEEDQ